MKYRNARYINNNGWIDCEIDHPAYGWVPYTLDPEDTDMTVDNNALRSLIGSDVTPYTPPTQEELDAKAAQSVRNERDLKLVSEVDPVAGNTLRWSALSAAKQTEWADYRQALLDVPQQSGFPMSVAWPTKPA